MGHSDVKHWRYDEDNLVIEREIIECAKPHKQALKFEGVAANTGGGSIDRGDEINDAHGPANPVWKEGQMYVPKD